MNWPFYQIVLLGAWLTTTATGRHDGPDKEPYLPPPAAAPSPADWEVPTLSAGESACGTLTPPTPPTICTDGLDKWTGTLGGTPSPVSSTAGPGLDVHMAIRHQVALSPIQNADTLFVFVTIDDDKTQDGDLDSLVIFLGPRGVLFLRGTTTPGSRWMRHVDGDPKSPSVVVGSTNDSSNCINDINNNARVCIEDDSPNPANVTSWRVEAKLVPSDFGMNAFSGTVPFYVRAVDKNNALASAWDSNTDPKDATTWKTLKLGTPIDLVLVLDFSGSMTLPACPATSCLSKQDVLKDAVGDFLTLLAAASVPSDLMTVRYFRNTVAAPGPGLPSTDLLPVPDSWGKFNTDVSGNSATGSTAMGAGLKQALALLAGKANPAVVLFTDGMQNVKPLVVDVTPGDLVCDGVNDDLWIDDSPFGNTGTGGAEDTPLGGSTPVPIYTIGLQSTTAVQECLKSIAEKSTQLSGALGYAYTDDPADDLSSLFLDALIVRLREHSPQLIAHRSGVLGSDGADESFVSDRAAQRMMLQLNWSGPDSLAFQIEKDGVDLTNAPTHELYESATSRVFALNLPTEIRGTRIAPGGVWRMHITGRPGVRYQVAGITDDLAMEYDMSVDAGVVGEPLRLNAAVRIGGTPISDALVRATVRRPGMGTGTLLSQNATPRAGAGLPLDSATPAQRKLQLLLRDEGLFRSIQSTRQSIILQSHGDGTYSAEFQPTDVVGSYRVTFTIEGEHEGVGAYRRAETRSTFVRFTPDPRASAVVATVVQHTPDLRRLVIRTVPRDPFGKPVGPGWGHQVRVALSQGSAQTDSIRDLVNGVYEIPITVPSHSDPNVTVSVMGEPLYQGPLSRLVTRDRFELGVYAGVAIPTGSFSSTFDPGFNVIVGGGYHVTPRALVGASFGYNNFRSNSAGVSDTYWINLSANARYRLDGNRVSPYWAIAPGVYIPKNGRARVGGSVGTGLDVPLGSVFFELGADYHKVFGAGTQFVHTHAGIYLTF